MVRIVFRRKIFKVSKKSPRAIWDTFKTVRISIFVNRSSFWSEVHDSENIRYEYISLGYFVHICFKLYFDVFRLLQACLIVYVVLPLQQGRNLEGPKYHYRPCHSLTHTSTWNRGELRKGYAEPSKSFCSGILSHSQSRVQLLKYYIYRHLLSFCNQAK